MVPVNGTVWYQQVICAQHQTGKTLLVEVIFVIHKAIDYLPSLPVVVPGIEINLARGTPRIVVVI